MSVLLARSMVGTQVLVKDLPGHPESTWTERKIFVELSICYARTLQAAHIKHEIQRRAVACGRDKD